jgi:RHS repeat-associated protein
MTSIHQPGQWVYNDNNELLAWGTDALKHAITYDLNGSTIKDEVGAPVVSKTTVYVYDAQDRMVEVRDNGVSIAKYAYDPMGRRIWRQAGAEITWFLYSDEGLIEELAAANASTRTYGWNPGGMWGTDTVWQKDANGVFLSNNDHLYTTDVLTGAVAGVKSWGGIRESFGKTTVQAGSATTYLMRFPGQWEDGVGGVSQNWWREYRSDAGRYFEQDPYKATKNIFYSYVGNNPIRYADFSGLVRWSGSYVSLAVTPFFGSGGGVDYYELTSSCVDGMRVRVRVIAPFFEVGFGLPLDFTAGTISLEDDQKTPSAASLSGFYYKVGANYGIGFGAAYAWVVMGRARSDLNSGNLTRPGNGINIGAGVGASFGYSFAWGKTYCCN